MGSSVAQELTYGQTGGSQTSGCLGQEMDFAGANVGAPSPAPEPPKPVEEGDDEGTPYSDTSLSILGLDKLRHFDILTQSNCCNSLRWSSLNALNVVLSK